MSYVLAFLGFAALIILHEFGHFVVAKAVGMRVERFALFFPPLVLKTRRGETEYGIGAIPLGGYVKITGMSPNEELAPEIAHRAYYRQPVWKRIAVIMAGPAMNLVIAFGILMVLFLSHGAAVTNSHGQAVASDRVTGPLRQPAASYLRPGDRILSVDGRDGGPAALSAQIRNHRCAGTPAPGCRATTPARLVVKRGTQRLSLAIYPRYDATEKRTLIGFGFAAKYRSVGPLDAAGTSVSTMWQVTRGTVSALAKRFYDPGNHELHGVVGSYEVTQKSFALSTTEAFYILALISLSLAVVNLFPFLPLDGGHVFWALAEKVRGRRISFSVMERASVVGFVLVILLFVIGFTNDLYTINHGGFQAPR